MKFVELEALGRRESLSPAVFRSLSGHAPSLEISPKLRGVLQSAARATFLPAALQLGPPLASSRQGRSQVGTCSFRSTSITRKALPRSAPYFRTSHPWKSATSRCFQRTLSSNHQDPRNSSKC